MSGPPVIQRVWGAFDSVTKGLIGLTTSGEAPFSPLLGSAQIVANIAALRLVTKAANVAAFVLGTNTPGDGGGDTYAFVSTDVTSGAVGTGSCSGTLLTITAMSSGTWAIGQSVSRGDTGVVIGTILSFGTGAGGTGTYNLSASATIIGPLTFMGDNNEDPVVAADGGRWYAVGATSLYPVRTPAEITAGVFPTNFNFPPDPIADFRRYGGVGNGTVDDSPAFINGTKVLAVNGGILQFTGTPLINANVTVSKNVTWEGPQGNPGIDNPVASGTYLQNGTILLNGANTLTLANKGGIKNCTILNSNFGPSGAFPLPFTGATNATNGVAAFAGTAITNGGDDSLAEELLILGFTTAYSSSGFERPRVRRVYADCTNGILLDAVTDITRVEDNHIFPFTTTHQAWTTTTLITRTGVGYRSTNHNDAGMLSKCFAFGYAIDFDIQSHEALDLIGCFADGPAAGVGQIGFKFTGVSDLINVIGGGSSGVDQGVYVNITAASTAGTVKLLGVNFWGNHEHIHTDQHKVLEIRNCHLRDTNAAPNTGITVNSAVTGITNIENNSFSAIANAYSLPALGTVARENITLRNNTYDLSNGTIANIFNDQNLSVNNDNLRQPIWNAYSTTLGGWGFQYKMFGGTPGAPSAVASGAIPWQASGSVYDGTAVNPVGQIRFGVNGAVGAGAVKGRVLFSINKNSNALTDTTMIDENGNLLPLTDNTYALGTNTGPFRWIVHASSFVSDATGVGFYSVNTGQAQPTTASAAATFVANAGVAVQDVSTFDGYTIAKVVRALRTLGILA